MGGQGRIVGAERRQDGVVLRLGGGRLVGVERAGSGAELEAQLASGLAANPPPERCPEGRRQRGRRKQSPARNPLERLWLGQEQVLAFLDDLTIPFDNNQTEQAERDLRLLKTQQKVSDCFRSEAGADALTRVRRGCPPFVSKEWRR